MVIATLFISLAVLIVIGAPIAVCIGFAPIAALVADGQASQLFVAAQRMVTALDSTVLVAIPLFVLAGVIMGKGGISKQIVNLCYELFGWMPAPSAWLRLSPVCSSLQSPVPHRRPLAAIGGILIPQMIDDGLSRRLFCGAGCFGRYHRLHHSPQHPLR